MLTLAMASTTIEVALARARAAGSKPVVIVVTDAGGLVVAAAREDNAGRARFELSLSKARSALALGMPTRTLTSFFESSPGLHGVLRDATNCDLLPVIGGVLITSAQGDLIGAAGISGGSLTEEEDFLLAGIAAAGLLSDPPAKPVTA